MKVTVPAVFVAALLLTGHLYYGLGYALGPPRVMSSGSFAIAVGWLPQLAWGWSIAAGALFTVAAPFTPPSSSPWWSIGLHIVASVPLLALSAAIALAELRGLAQGWGGTSLFLSPALLHGLLSWARLRHGRVPRAAV